MTYFWATVKNRLEDALVCLIGVFVLWKAEQLGVCLSLGQKVRVRGVVLHPRPIYVTSIDLIELKK